LKTKSLITAIAILFMTAFTGSVHSETFTFTHSNPFVFGNPTASSTLAVNGVVGNVIDVNVTLSGIEAINASDGIEEFDILLAGPQGNKIILMAFVCDFTDGPVNFTFDNSASSNLPQGDQGVSCNSGTYKPSDYAVFGDGYTITSPPAPSPPYSLNLGNLNGENPNGTWTLWAAEWAFSHQGGRVQSWTITIETDSVESCVLFNDEFDDGVVDWNIIKPNAIENGGNTTLIPSNKKGEIGANNVFSGCGSNCTLNTTFQTPGGNGSKVWVLGWIVDKQNLIELLFREDKNRVTIRQRVNKTIVRKSSVNFQINPNQSYPVTMIYNGSTITVLINGSSIGLTLTPVGSLDGSVGLRSTNTSSTFTHMCVD
jgi:hypothetical protein